MLRQQTTPRILPQQFEQLTPATLIQFGNDEAFESLHRPVQLSGVRQSKV